jgi:hypothetical protein
VIFVTTLLGFEQKQRTVETQGKYNQTSFNNEAHSMEGVLVFLNAYTGIRKRL